MSIPKMFLTQYRRSAADIERVLKVKKPRDGQHHEAFTACNQAPISLA
jgi:hypothetical protein